jgi:hypothetical protein
MLAPRLAAVLPLAALAAALSFALPAKAQGRPDCAAVIRQMHRITGHDGAGTPDVSEVAEKLKTDSAWVERCATSYGRRVKPRRRSPSEGDEGLSAKAEAREYEELAREERGQQANYAQGDPDNYKNRNRLRGIDPDSSAEWEPYITHEWAPYTTHEWTPYILDDDNPGVE